MKRLFFTFFLASFLAQAQDLNAFNQARLKRDQGLMLSLGAWAGANITAGTIGWATAQQPELKAFHQMNVMWNTVNLGLAIPGYLRAHNTKRVLSLSQTLTVQKKTERIFLFNSGLDIAYISVGFLLRNMALNNQTKAYQLNGFGNGLILQGSFLFAFDLTAYAVHHRHGKKVLRFIERKE
jgi:hypothetical protein